MTVWHMARQESAESATISPFINAQERHALRLRTRCLRTIHPVASCNTSWHEFARLSLLFNVKPLSKVVFGMPEANLGGTQAGGAPEGRESLWEDLGVA